MSIKQVFESITHAPYYQVKEVTYECARGLALVNKRKNITRIHQNYLQSNAERKVLEVSSKSMQETGIRLSAFNLKDENGHTVECVFQSSKKFENGGPYTELKEKTSIEAKKDERLKSSGKLIAFIHEGVEYPLEPKTAFYDWIYINALLKNKDLCEELKEYDAFTDVEFNFKKSLNCQAEACAMYCGLVKAGKLEEAMKSFEDFVNVIYLGGKND